MNPAPMTFEGAKAEVLSTSQLRERGWTGSLIRQFLPIPDGVRPNPHYRSAAPMRLYRLDRIVATEETPEFRKAKAEAEKRRQASRKANETKRDQTREWAASLPAPKIPRVTRAELLAAAVRWHNETRAWTDPGANWATVRDPDPVLAELAVNYVREKLRRHKDRSLQAFGLVAKESAAAVIDEKIIEAIAAAYPWLSQECQRQQAALPCEGLPA